MKTYVNAEELKNEINNSFNKYIIEFDNIPESLKDKRIDEVDRTPSENLAYQLGWTSLLLKWEKDERAGLIVKTPSDLFKWNQLTDLYKWFNDTYAYLSLAELKSKLKENIEAIDLMIDEMSEEELLAHGMNQSFTHVDFMVGTSDLSIEATLKNGEKIHIFKDGKYTSEFDEYTLN